MLQSTLISWILISRNISLYSVIQIFAGLTVAAFAVFSLAYRVLYTEGISAQKLDNSPPKLLLPVGEIASSFFGNTFDFFNNGFKATSSSIFQFRLFRHDVIALSGDEGRHAFFQEKGLDLYHGFQIIIGTIPAGLSSHELNSIYRRINYLQRPDNLEFLIPLLLSDCRRKMDLWSGEGLLNPDSAIHEITFQMVIRAVTSFDVADNPALVSRLKRYYDVIDSSFSPVSVRFPWLPGPSIFQKIFASACVYLAFKSALHDRKNSRIRRQDALQQLLDAEESETCILKLMMGLPIAGARSTGTIGTWLIMFLSSDPDWTLAVRREIHTLISTYNTSLSCSISGEALIQALSAIPLTAWESNTPCLDLCIRETLRSAQPHTSVRKNMGPAFTVGPYTVPSGAYVAYPFSDTFLNPTYYPDPTRWNPARSVHQEEVYLGWGGGKHVCKGQRLATLTMKLVAACALMRFDLVIVNEQGEKMHTPPVPDWNDFLACRPKDKCSIKFTERQEWFMGAAC